MSRTQIREGWFGRESESHSLVRRGQITNYDVHETRDIVEKMWSNGRGERLPSPRQGLRQTAGLDQSVSRFKQWSIVVHALL
jgi:hypothetical protein